MSKISQPLNNSNANNYKIIKLLNQGGMGEIYLAEDKRLQRTVAIKKIKNELITDNNKNALINNEIAIKNTLNEARLLAKLNHPNIVQIYDIVPESQQISLVMEYLDGKTLQCYQKENILSLAQKIAILSQISKALAAAHTQDIVHCDLKSANIIIDNNAVVKIVDFGIAKFTNVNSNTTNSSQIFGSQTAMSPEQLQNMLAFSKGNNNVKDIDFRSDLFSLGIIAFQLISGRHPFAGNSSTATAQNILSCNEKAHFLPEDIVPKLPNELISLLNKLLAFNPENRPSDSQWVQRQFDQIAQHLHQQDIFDEDTLPLNSSITENLTLPANNNANSQVSNKTITKRTKTILLSVIIVIAVCFGLLNNNVNLLSAEPPPNRYVVVLPATITHSNSGQAIAEMQKSLITASIDDGIRQSIINTKGLKLISSRETDNSNKAAHGDINIIGAATGASDIITTELICNNIRCNVSLSRLTANKSKKWTVLSQKSWPTQLNRYKEIYTSSQTNINALYPNYIDTYLNTVNINEEDYQTYIQLYEKIKVQGINNDQNLKKLKELLIKTPYLYAGYSLFRASALDMYNETYNETYLLQIQQLINTAPPEYKYSIFQAIDTFMVKITLGDMISAKNQLDIITEHEIDHASLSELEGILFFSENKLAQAIEKYKTALALRPNTNILYNLALAYNYLGDFESAKKTLNQQLRINPMAYKPNQLLAAIHLFEGNLKSAISRYENVIKISMQNTDVNNLSLAYSLSGRYQEALTMAQLAVNISPNDPTSMLNLADAEMLVGLKEKAKVNYEKIITLHKEETNLIALQESAQAYVHLGNHNSAIKAINQAKKLAPDNAEVAFTAALVYSQLGENISAVNQVEEAISADFGIIWFHLPWFDKLCNTAKFRQLLANANNAERCLHH